MTWIFNNILFDFLTCRDYTNEMNDVPHLEKAISIL